MLSVALGVDGGVRDGEILPVKLTDFNWEGLCVANPEPLPERLGVSVKDGLELASCEPVTDFELLLEHDCVGENVIVWLVVAEVEGD